MTIGEEGDAEEEMVLTEEGMTTEEEGEMIDRTHGDIV